MSVFESFIIIAKIKQISNSAKCEFVWSYQSVCYYLVSTQHMFSFCLFTWCYTFSCSLEKIPSLVLKWAVEIQNGSLRKLRAMYVCVLWGFLCSYWLCLPHCLDTLNSELIFGKAPFGSLTADVWLSMCLSCGAGPDRLTECLLSGCLNRCLSAYAFSARDQQKACVFLDSTTLFILWCKNWKQF